MLRFFLIQTFVFVLLSAGNISGQVGTKTIFENINSNNTESREKLVAFAKQFLGVPYKYASAEPGNGFDCSGFVQYVFKNFDIAVPHSSKGFVNLGKPVKPEDFKIGDIIIFYGFRNFTQIGHVGIICEAAGMNSKFIHSSSGKTKGVTISELSSDSYTRRFFQCIDILGKD